MATTVARPPGRVLVTGLGPIGHLTAQIFSSIGYQVDGFDPLPQRKKDLQDKGISAIDAIPEGEIYDIAIECSAHEMSVLQATKAVRLGGEVVLVGVPWKRNCDLYAQEIFSVLFHRYVTLRGGWEGGVPGERRSFDKASAHEHIEAAMKWLGNGRINVEGLYDLANPQDCQEVYGSLLARTRKTMATVFDWRQ